MELDVRNKGKIPVTYYPDFSAQGYEVVRELGRNQEGGRITYLARVCNSHKLVVIKEFSFDITATDWSGSKAYEREIEILQQLDYPRIPRYIDSFVTSVSFCLVQEYKNAPSLGTKRDFSPTEVKQIAISILEILVYLQQQIDPIIHRDIKPENILVDEQLNAYLVDFGLASRQSAEIAFSTLSTGTPGFVPPEEQFGYALTQASDLYSLGATLICLLTNTHTGDISKLIDHGDRCQFPKLSNQLHPSFRSWLLTMVQPNWKDRYPNATVALAALEPIPVMGNASLIEILFAAIQLKKRTAMLILAVLGMLAVAGTTLVFSQQGGAAQQLKESNSLINFQ
ncbi:serine/threonine protein kinase [Nostoc sp. FACHB-152]|uniref:serine/threonine protein kinase n=1 Tax=unclassified Nostoc TaxID=2593658 RepID=UPI001689DC8E|nr:MULTISPECIES: serine/threonine-protein kinase [unclassified Nostoc]MBD2450707.1 serine/threonine protein kinase [Nostoc sp. FACHB-152]MBD2471919.1 serine/threonine protein kinase [Nostoc sp. FACHB-145]